MAGFIQGKTAQGSNVTTLTATFGSAVTAGNLLVAGLDTANTSGATASDNVNAGNYSVSDNHSTTNNADDLALFYKENAGAGTPTITVTLSAGNAAIATGECNGPLTAASLDVHGATDANGTTITSGSLTSTGANGDLLISIISHSTQNVTDSNTTAGWTVNETNSPNATESISLASRVQAASGAFTTTWGVTGAAQDLSVLVAAFKLQASGTVAATVIRVIQKPRLFFHPSRAFVAPQTPTFPATLPTVAKQKPPLRKRQSISLVAPQTPTFVATTPRVAIQKRKVKPVPPKSLVAPQTPTFVATANKARQKKPLVPLKEYKTLVATAPPAVVVPTTSVARQKRPLKPLKPVTAGVAPPTPTVPATSSVAIRKRPHFIVRRKTPTAFVSTAIVDLTPTVPKQGKKRLPLKPPLPKAVTASQAPTFPATSTTAIQKRKVKPVPPKALAAPVTPTAPATVPAVARQKRPQRPLKPRATTNPFVPGQAATAVVGLQKRPLKPIRRGSAATSGIPTPPGVPATSVKARQKPRILPKLSPLSRVALLPFLSEGCITLQDSLVFPIALTDFN